MERKVKIFLIGYARRLNDSSLKLLFGVSLHDKKSGQEIALHLPVNGLSAEQNAPFARSITLEKTR